MTEDRTPAEINKSPEFKKTQVYGISGITDENFREGFDPQTRTFNKLLANMRTKRYLNYCRIEDLEQVKLILNEGKTV